MAREVSVRELGVARVHRGAGFGLAADGTLTIDAERLIEHLRADPRLHDVRVELAPPGARVKVVGVLDSAEPRGFIETDRDVFPGVAAPPRINDGGTLVCLRGCAVVLCGWEPWFDEDTHGVQTPFAAFIDMAGSGTRHCLNADTANIVVTMRAECSPPSYAELARDTIVRAARFVGREVATRELPAAGVEPFGRRPSPGARKVVYIDQIRDQGPFVGTYLYGWPLTQQLPTLLVPGQLFEGALVTGDYRGALGVATYLHQNNPFLRSLLHAEDAGRVEVAGIVLSRGNFESIDDKRRSAELVAHLAASVVAEGAVISIEGFGNATVDFMETIAACTRRGVQTVGVIHEPVVSWSDDVTHLVSIGAGMGLGADAGIAGTDVEYLDADVTSVGAIHARTAAARGLSEARRPAPFCMLWRQGDAGVTCREF